MSTIKTGTTLTTAYQVVGDTTGTFVVQTGSTPTTALTIDTSQNVGIGTSSPDYQLDVSGTSTSTTTLGVGISVENLSFTTNTRAGIVFRNGDNYGASVWSPRTGSSAGALVFGTNNAAGTAETNIVERVRIDSSGNVGIGTNYPNFQTSGRVVVDTNGSSQSMYSLSTGGTARAYYVATSTVTELGSQANPMAFTVNGAERARIDTSGNVGIGNTTPAADSRIDARLDNSGSTAWIRIQNQSGTANSKAGFKMSTVNGDWQMYANRSGGFYIDTPSVASAVNIDNSGNLLVGTTSSQVNNKHIGLNGVLVPINGVDPGGNIGGGFAIGGNYTSPVAGRIFFGDNTGWRLEMGPRPAGGFIARFHFSDGGAAYNTTGTWGTISDARLKENVVDANPKLNEVMHLRVRNFNFITEPDLKHIGFVAQEVEEIFPGLVDESRADENGNTTKSVKTTVLIPVLVKAIQELNAKVDAQAAEIAALKGQ